MNAPAAASIAQHFSGPAFQLGWCNYLRRVRGEFERLQAANQGRSADYPIAMAELRKLVERLQVEIAMMTAAWFDRSAFGASLESPVPLAHFPA